MSYVIAAPAAVTAAANDLARIGSTIGTADTAAAAKTTQLLAAGVAELFAADGQAYQALGAQAAAFHTRFVRAVTSAGGAYAAAEAANATPLTSLQQELQSLALFTPVKDLTGRPLIGDGTNGAAGTGRNGGDGGWRIGNGGTGGSGAVPPCAAVTAAPCPAPPQPAPAAAAGVLG